MLEASETAFWSTAAQASVVLALTLVVDFRVAARSWKFSHLRRLRIEAAAFFVSAEILWVVFAASMSVLAGGDAIIPRWLVASALTLVASIELLLPVAYALGRAMALKSLGPWHSFARRIPITRWLLHLPFRQRLRRLEVRVHAHVREVETYEPVAREILSALREPVRSAEEAILLTKPLVTLTKFDSLPLYFGYVYASLARSGQPERFAPISRTTMCMFLSDTYEAQAEARALVAELEDIKSGSVGRELDRAQIEAILAGAGRDFIVPFADDHPAHPSMEPPQHHRAD